MQYAAAGRRPDDQRHHPLFALPLKMGSEPLQQPGQELRIAAERLTVGMARQLRREGRARNRETVRQRIVVLARDDIPSASQAANSRRLCPSGKTSDRADYHMTCRVMSSKSFAMFYKTVEMTFSACTRRRERIPNLRFDDRVLSEIPGHAPDTQIDATGVHATSDRKLSPCGHADAVSPQFGS